VSQQKLIFLSFLFRESRKIFNFARSDGVTFAMQLNIVTLTVCDFRLII